MQEVIVTKANLNASQLPSVFPSGDYKMFFNHERENGELLLSYYVAASVISSDKNTFG